MSQCRTKRQKRWKKKKERKKKCLVDKHFPLPIMSGRSKGGKAKSKTRSPRAGLQFPVGRVHRLLRNGNYSERVFVSEFLFAFLRILEQSKRQVSLSFYMCQTAFTGFENSGLCILCMSRPQIKAAPKRFVAQGHTVAVWSAWTPFSWQPARLDFEHSTFSSKFYLTTV